MKRRNTIIGIIVGLLVLAAIGLLIAWMVHGQGYAYGPRMMRGWHVGMMWGSQSGGGLLRGAACLLGLVFLGGLVWLVVSLLQGHRAEPPREQLPREESALEILKRRYARGEISQEEYERMKQELA